MLNPAPSASTSTSTRRARPEAADPSYYGRVSKSRCSVSNSSLASRDSVGQPKRSSSTKHRGTTGVTAEPDGVHIIDQDERPPSIIVSEFQASVKAGQI